MVRPQRLFFTTLALATLIGVLLAGCVTTDPQQALGLNDLPPDKAAVFIAVNMELPDSNDLQLAFDSEHEVTLAQEAISRIYLDPGWYQMDLIRLPQPENNLAMRYRFDAGEVYRYTLVKRNSPKPDTLVAEEWESDPELEQYVYAVVPATSDAYDQMLINQGYPVRDLTPK